MSKATAEIDDLRLTKKSDRAAPESPVIPVDSKAGADLNASPAAPEPAKPKKGETLAQYESHVLMSSDEAIAERIKLEQEKGLPTDVIARRQQEEAVAGEARARLDSTPPPSLLTEDSGTKTKSTSSTKSSSSAAKSGAKSDETK